jgi:hypothetical protein
VLVCSLSITPSPGVGSAPPFVFFSLVFSAFLLINKKHLGGGFAPLPVTTQKKDIPKLPAWHNKADDDAGYTYTTRLHEAAADHKGNAAMDYHQYPTTNARYLDYLAWQFSNPSLPLITVVASFW